MSDMIKLIEEIKPSKASRKIKKCGYAWWGFSSDVRMRNGKPFSSADGSLLTAFSLLYELQQRGIETYRIYPDRDIEYIMQQEYYIKDAFKSFSQEKRTKAYLRTRPVFHDIKNKEFHFPDVDVVILEWRMKTRYNELPEEHSDFQPDYLLQEAAIEHYRAKGTSIICLDLDYKMDPEKDDQLFYYVFEPGFKRGWEHYFAAPYILEDINQFEMLEPKSEIVYIGNRYERDNEFDQFFGTPTDQVEFNVYGSWLENGRDSAQRWPHVNFRERIQPYQMRDAYKYALTTPLLLKPEYNQKGFMSIRIIESLLFGTIPVLPKQFQSPIAYAYVPRVENEEEMLEIVQSPLFTQEYGRKMLRRAIINDVQIHDVEYFVNKLLSIL